MTTPLTLPDVLASASVHAVDLDTGADVGLEPDVALPLASVVKVPWAVAVHRSADAGEVSLADRLRVDPVTATPGPTGVSSWSDPVELSLRDATHLALAQSDNASADALLDHVGIDRVRTRCTEIGLPKSVARQPIRTLYDDLAHLSETARAHDAVDRLREDPTLLTGLPGLDEGRANSASARELTALLAMVWRDAACSPSGCAAVRDSLMQPMSPGRIARGLGSHDLQIANKSGTQLTVRHDVGWVRFPDRRSYVLAVLTRAHRLGEEQAQDEAVGALARQAVQALRA